MVDSLARVSYMVNPPSTRSDPQPHPFCKSVSERGHGSPGEATTATRPSSRPETPDPREARESQHP
jgi:hypothetical protein